MKIVSTISQRWCVFEAPGTHELIHRCPEIALIQSGRFWFMGLARTVLGTIFSALYSGLARATLILAEGVRPRVWCAADSYDCSLR